MVQNSIPPSLEFLIDMGPNELSTGLYALLDETDSPIGSARIMTNIMITDRGGIAPRPGTQVLGTYENGVALDGLANFIKSNGEVEIPIKASNGILKYFHPTLLDWEQLQTGYTPGSEFGFKSALVNSDNEDYEYYGNRTQPYSRWIGAIGVTVGALTGAETTLTVDTTLKPDIYDSDLAGPWIVTHTATTLSDNSKVWVDSQWINFYIKITSGIYSGYIRKITAVVGSTSTLTFDTLPGDPGICSYEIRMIKYPVSGTLMVGTTLITYSAIPTSNTFTITPPGVVIANNSPIAATPIAFPQDPKGNRLELHYTRMIVGNVLSALSRDSSGVVQGSQSTGSWYYSKGGIGKLADQTDFTFAATRNAGDGGIESVPYGGGDITDIANQEDTFYVFKKVYIEADKFSQDTNDLPLRTQLKTGFGSVGHVVKGRDDIYFVTADSQITSVQRVKLADTLPQSVNIGLPIKRLLETYDFSDVNGAEYKNRLFFACKQTADDTHNNQIIVYNRTTKSFEGIWEIGASGFITYKDNLYYGESANSNVWEMFTGYNDVRSDAHKFGISSQWVTNWMHVAPVQRRKRISHFETLGLTTFAVEGYILDGTQITLSIYKGFETDASLQFTFGNDDADLQFEQNVNLLDYLGANPLGFDPLGLISDPDSNGLRHFQFLVYFPPIYANYIAFGVECSGKDQYYEITRLAANTLEQQMRDNVNIKSIR